MLARIPITAIVTSNSINVKAQFFPGLPEDGAAAAWVGRLIW
jgi:hypothetical protein